MNENPDFDASVPMLLYRTLDAVMPAYRELFAHYELTEQQWRVLRVIWSSRNVTSAHLSERTLLSAPSLVSIIDRLEKKGLVQRVRSVEDRRAVYIIATAEGRALQETVLPKVATIQSEITARLSEAEWQQLEGLLAAVCGNRASLGSIQIVNE